VDSSLTVAIVAASASIGGALVTVASSLVAGRQGHRRELALERLRHDLQEAAARVREEAKQVEAREAQELAEDRLRQSDLVRIVESLQRFKDEIYSICGTSNLPSDARYSLSDSGLDLIAHRKRQVLDLYTSVSTRLIPYEVAVLHDVKNMLIEFTARAAEDLARVRRVRTLSPENEDELHSPVQIQPHWILKEVNSAQEYFRVQIRDPSSSAG
jgi:hypothetical protein